MTVREFINQVFLAEYKRLLDQGFHYISFALMGLGIEFLGACLDTYDFGRRGQSGARFALAIQDLFPAKYHQYAKALHEDLRSGFAHQFRPGSRFALTHLKESAREGTVHLVSHNNQVVLVAEDFYQDFGAACTKVITMIDKQTLMHSKLTARFLKVT